MFDREIVGLYLENNQLHYVCMGKRFGGWTPKRLDPTVEASGKIFGPETTCLRDFLKDISPRKRRRMYLTLPRHRFFARDLQLPPMPLEDAFESVRNSLSIHSHLPLDEIYHDIQLCSSLQGGVNAIVFYARRKDMDLYIDLFEDTGHLDSLGGIFPVSIGLGAWLSFQGYELPLGLVVRQDGINELAVYHRKGCLSSVAWSLSAKEKEEHLLTNMAISKFAEIKDRIFYLQNEDGPTLPQSARKPFSDLPRITENLGVAAIAPVISGRRSISLDGNPAKIKSLPLRWIFIPSVLAIVFLATLFTWRVDQELIRLEQDSKAFQTNVEQLNKRLEPIEQNRALLKEAQETMKDVNDFLKTKPRLFRHINDIARLVPENTWFTNLSFKDGVITLQGESKDALKVIEILREAGLFAQVRLSGSVSRLKTGVERFTFSVKLKDQESDTLENRENVKENHFGNT